MPVLIGMLPLDTLKFLDVFLLGPSSLRALQIQLIFPSSLCGLNVDSSTSLWSIIAFPFDLNQTDMINITLSHFSTSLRHFAAEFDGQVRTVLSHQSEILKNMIYLKAAIEKSKQALEYAQIRPGQIANMS